MKVTPSMEDYLEAIYNLTGKSQQVRVTDVAQTLGIAKPSVHAAMHGLKELDLVTQEHYGQIGLTEKGEAEAVRVIKKHAIIRSFLLDVLHINPERAEEEACAIEHVMSMETVERLEELINRR